MSSSLAIPEVSDKRNQLLDRVQQVLCSTSWQVLASVVRRVSLATSYASAGIDAVVLAHSDS